MFKSSSPFRGAAISNKTPGFISGFPFLPRLLNRVKGLFPVSLFLKCLNRYYALLHQIFCCADFSVVKRLHWIAALLWVNWTLSNSFTMKWDCEITRPCLSDRPLEYDIFRSIKIRVIQPFVLFSLLDVGTRLLNTISLGRNFSVGRLLNFSPTSWRIHTRTHLHTLL